MKREYEARVATEKTDLRRTRKKRRVCEEAIDVLKSRSQKVAQFEQEVADLYDELVPASNKTAAVTPREAKLKATLSKESEDLARERQCVEHVAQCVQLMKQRQELLAQCSNQTLERVKLQRLAIAGESLASRVARDGPDGSALAELRRDASFTAAAKSSTSTRLLASVPSFRFDATSVSWRRPLHLSSGEFFKPAPTLFGSYDNPVALGYISVRTLENGVECLLVGQQDAHSLVWLQVNSQHTVLCLSENVVSKKDDASRSNADIWSINDASTLASNDLFMALDDPHTFFEITIDESGENRLLIQPRKSWNSAPRLTLEFFTAQDLECMIFGLQRLLRKAIAPVQRPSSSTASSAAPTPMSNDSIVSVGEAAVPSPTNNPDGSRRNLNSLRKGRLVVHLQPCAAQVAQRVVEECSESIVDFVREEVLQGNAYAGMSQEVVSWLREMEGLQLTESTLQTHVVLLSTSRIMNNPSNVNILRLASLWEDIIVATCKKSEALMIPRRLLFPPLPAHVHLE